MHWVPANHKDGCISMQANQNVAHVPVSGITYNAQRRGDDAETAPGQLLDGLDVRRDVAVDAPAAELGALAGRQVQDLAEHLVDEHAPQPHPCKAAAAASLQPMQLLCLVK